MSSGTSRLSGATSGTSSVMCPSRICLAPNFSRSTFFTFVVGLVVGAAERAAKRRGSCPVAASAASGEGRGLEEGAAGTARIAHGLQRPGQLKYNSRFDVGLRTLLSVRH